MTGLTDRQQQVADCVAAGLSNKEIAERLDMSLRRVSQHITRIAQLWRLDPDRSLRVQIAKHAA